MGLLLMDGGGEKAERCLLIHFAHPASMEEDSKNPDIVPGKG